MQALGRVGGCLQVRQNALVSWRPCRLEQGAHALRQAGFQRASWEGDSVKPGL